MSAPIKPHTCSEYNPQSKVVCGKPAKFRLDMVPTDDKTTKISSWKCVYHIRRYHDIKGYRLTITATKTAADSVSRPRSSQPKGSVGRGTRSRK